jgi:hypothetical protein
MVFALAENSGVDDDSLRDCWVVLTHYTSLKQMSQTKTRQQRRLSAEPRAQTVVK